MRDYNGKGIAFFKDGVEVGGDFTLNVRDDGKINLHLYAEKIPVQIITLDIEPIKFIGESYDKEYVITINILYLTRVNLGKENYLEFKIVNLIEINYQDVSPTDKIQITRGLTNLLFNGLEHSVKNNVYRYDIITINIDGKDMQLKQVDKYADTVNMIKEFNTVRNTCVLKIYGLYNERDLLIEILENIQVLCSLASCNYVTAMYDDIFKDNGLCKTILYPLKTYPFSNDIPLIDTRLHDVNEFKEYIEIVYQNYKDLKDILGLPYLIEFFITSKIFYPMEINYLLNTTTLECLHDYFIKWKKIKNTTLKNKIRRILKHFKIPYNEQELKFTKIRNSIVHEGRFPSNINKYKSLKELRNLSDRIFLSILGYHGKPYYNIVLNKKENL